MSLGKASSSTKTRRWRRAVRGARRAREHEHNYGSGYQREDDVYEASFTIAKELKTNPIIVKAKKVTAAGNATYKSGSKTVMLAITVK